MAYSGFLLKIGDWVFPESLMAANSYSPYVNMQDVDPWTDENGELHRNPIDLKALKVEFETKNMLTSTQFAEIMRNILYSGIWLRFEHAGEQRKAKNKQ